MQWSRVLARNSRGNVPKKTAKETGLIKHLARFILRLFGWRLVGRRPAEKRCVLIAAPHTSNWDFPWMLLFAAAFEMKVNWLAKHTLFRPPFGFVMRALGGVPVVRHAPQNLVVQLAKTFAERESFTLLIPVEATRSRSEHWKSGFYRIAQRAGVPIVPAFLDYGRKSAGFGPPLWPGDSLTDDMNVFREFYAPIVAKHPSQFGPVRLPEE